jgi:hypothetical protein
MTTTKVAALLILAPIGLVELVLRLVLVVFLVASIVGLFVLLDMVEVDNLVTPYSWNLLDATIREW